MNFKIKSLLGAAILMINTSANYAMATKLSDNLVVTPEKKSITIINEHKTSHIIEDSVAKLETEGQVTSDKKPTPLARALAQSSNQLATDEFNVDKTLTLKISELKDNSGLVYLGGKVSAADLSRYLEQLKNEVGEEKYATYRQYQSIRDHQSFHVTLVNPYEYQTIDKLKLNLSTPFRVTLHGVGRVEKDNNKSYFVVASSSDGQYIRQGLLLKNKDFHVTLGFSPADVFGVSKGRDTLINK
ncbi:MAG: hypothetical protein WBC60_13210 [Cognaticolwellia sp.]